MQNSDKSSLAELAFNSNSVSSVIPSLEEWLALPSEELAEYVRPHRLSVMMSVDGTQRHFLLKRAPHLENQPFDFSEYAQAVFMPLAALFDRLFSLGVETVINPPLIRGNYDRPNNHAGKVVEYSRYVFGNKVFEELYRRHGVRVRLCGDYDLSASAAPYRPDFEKLAARLDEVSAVRNPSSQDWQPRLLLSFYIDSFTQEIIGRTQQLSEAGEEVTLERVRQACFPEGPDKLDILIEAGWLRVGGLVHPILDRGETDVYSLNFLALDLDEDTLRRILYDRIFLRSARSPETQNYTPQELEALREYYREHQGCLVGLGHLAGPGLWYPDHRHTAGNHLSAQFV